MLWFFYNYHTKYPYQKKIWIKIRFLHTTNKAIPHYKVLPCRFQKRELLTLKVPTQHLIL